MRKYIPYVIIIAAIGVAIGYTWVGWNIMQNQPDFSESYTTAVNEQKDITLPDGSQLRLDSDSVAEVSFSKKIRKVTVQKGQVIFTVDHQDPKPFEVVAGKMRVKAAGPRFSVNTIREGTKLKAVRATALEGSAHAERNSIWPFQPHVELAPGQGASMDAGGDFIDVNTAQ